MRIEEKVDRSLSLIAESVMTHSSPVVLWSGGADSQVTLWMARQVKPQIPVFFFRESFQESKFAFNRRMIAEWKLQVFTAYPANVEVVANGEFLEILNVLRLDESSVLYLPTGINSNEQPQDSWECGVDVSLKPTTPEIQWHWDLALIGHRGDDVDPIHGAIPLSGATAKIGSIDVAYPLAEWTRSDIWEASERYNIPQNLDRYDAANDYREFADLSRNPDYMDICVECLKPGGSAFVHCPKVGASVPRISEQLNAEARAAAWRTVFVNIAGNSNG